MRFSENQFIESLNGIPVEDIVRVVEQECRRVENSPLKKRLSLDESVISILIFRRFINAVMLDVHLTHYVLPTEHMATYRKTVARLVEAKKLPTGAKEEFDRTFSAAERENECAKRADAAFLEAEK